MPFAVVVVSIVVVIVIVAVVVVILALNYWKQFKCKNKKLPTVSRYYYRANQLLAAFAVMMIGTITGA